MIPIVKPIYFASRPLTQPGRVTLDAYRKRGKMIPLIVCGICVALVGGMMLTAKLFERSRKGTT